MSQQHPDGQLPVPVSYSMPTVPSSKTPPPFRGSFTAVPQPQESRSGTFSPTFREFRECDSDEEPDVDDSLASRRPMIAQALNAVLSARASISYDADGVRCPPLPSKPRPTISYSITDGGYRPHARGSISSLSSFPEAPTPPLPPSVSGLAVSAPPAPSQAPGAVSVLSPPAAAGAAADAPPPYMQWEQDSPDFWRQLTTLKAACTRFSNRVHRDSTALGPECLCTSPVALLHYSESLQQATAAQPPPAAAPASLDGPAMARLISQVSELRTDLSRRLEQACSAEETVSVRVKAVHEQHARYEELKARHVEKLRAYLALKSNTDARKLYEKSVKLGATEQFLELERYGLYATLAQVHDNMELALVKPLADRLSALSDFFMAGAALLVPHQAAIAALVERGRALELREEEAAGRYERLGKRVERESGDLYRADHEQAAAAGGGFALPVLSQLLGRDKKDKEREELGIRDLDSRRRAPGGTEAKRGYLFLPLRDCERAWVEVGGDVVTVWDAAKTEVLHTVPLLIATVKQQRESKNKLRFVLALITPQATVQLQAESEVGLYSWIDSIQTAIGRCLNHSHAARPADEPPRDGTPSTAGAAAVVASMLTKRLSTQLGVSSSSAGHSDTLRALWAVPGNEACADCGAAQPDWLSLNLGVVVCLECSSAHRLMGVDVSKVRSANMDVIDPLTAQYMAAIGNTHANKVFLANHTGTLPTLSPDADRATRTAFIQDKYQRRRWAWPEHLRIAGVEIPPEPARQPALDAALLAGVRCTALDAVYQALVLGARPDAVCADNEGRSCVHEAVMYCDLRVCLAVLAFAGPAAGQDDRGWTPLHYAAYSNRAALVDACIASAGSAASHERDAQGRTPREVALECNVGDEYAAELPGVVAALEKAERRYEQKLMKDRS